MRSGGRHALSLQASQTGSPHDERAPWFVLLTQKTLCRHAEQLTMRVLESSYDGISVPGGRRPALCISSSTGMNPPSAMKKETVNSDPRQKGHFPVL